MPDQQSLHKNSIGFIGLVFQSLTSIAPLMDMIAFITTASLFALASVPLSFLLAFITTFLTINTIFQFSKKVASSGGYYSFVGLGLGSRAGLFTGWIYLLYTWLVVPNAALFFGAIFVPAVFQFLTGVILPSYAWVVLSLVLILFVTGMAYLGIKPSLKYSIITGTIEISIMVLFSLVIIVRSGADNTPLVFTPIFARGGLSGVALGMIFSIISFAGSGTPVILGEEAKLPHKTIGKAVIASVIISGSAILFSAYALIIGWGTSQVSSFATQLIPGISEARRYLGIAGAAVIVIFGVNSFLNLGLSYFNAGVRSMFAIARDGVILPKKLAAIKEKRNTPYLAILAYFLIALSLSIPIALWIGPYTAFIIEVTGVGVGYFIVHILANLSLGVYFHKIKELSILKHIVIPSLSTVVFVITLYYSITPISFPVSYGVIAVFAWALIGAVYISTIGIDKLQGTAKYNILEKPNE
jgi:amino acid transporter